MEYHKTTLFEAVDASRHDDTRYLECIMRGLAGLLSAVEHMLSKGVVHLDFKADNVLVGQEGEPIVIDFGHCALYPHDTTTLPATSMGNPLHAAPEFREANKRRLAGNFSGEKLVVFGIGVLVAECLTATYDHPFEEYDMGKWNVSFLTATVRFFFTWFFPMVFPHCKKR